MDLGRQRSAAGSRLLISYLVVSLVPVLALMLAMPAALRFEARSRGLAEARAQAALLAQASVEPLLGAAPLRGGVSRAQTTALARLAAQTVQEGHIVRLRLRDIDGRVVFADDADVSARPDEEATDALQGEVTSVLTRLNADPGERLPLGERVVEVYRPLREGPDHHVVGVLELYLPYGPIQADVNAGLGALTLVCTGGLALLYLVLALVSASATRRMRKQATDNAFLARTDPLSGLPNRTSFRADVDEALLRQPSTVAVAVLDLEGFREINETLGHKHGDNVLRVVAQRLLRAVPEGDGVARLAGDEFAVLMTGLSWISPDDDATERLERIQRELVAELTIGGIPLAVEASFGLAMAGASDQAPDGADLIRQADIALHQAKLIRRPLVRYTVELDQYDPAKLGLLAELRRGIEGEQLVLHYQPKLDLVDGTVRSAEALVRWTRPDGSLLQPAEFIDAAESTGLIEPLTDWVIAAALRQITLWGDDLGEVVVAVNISARNLAQPGFATGVLRTMAIAGVPTSRLVMEITETALLADPDTARSALEILDKAGVAVAIDDFGQGHTALGYLADLPVRELKIDRGLIRKVGSFPAHDAIVRSIIELGHNLGLRVVAEGVSQPDIMQRLGELGCDVVQGWLIGHAMPAEQFAAWLTAHRRERAAAPSNGGADADHLGQGLG